MNKKVKSSLFKGNLRVNKEVVVVFIIIIFMIFYICICFEINLKVVMIELFRVDEMSARISK
jgi:hypothetical protein